MAMEAVIPIVDTILKSITLLKRWANENQKLQGKIVGSLQRLWSEVTMAEWDMARYDGAEELTLQMQELLCDIEDFTSDLSIPEKRAAFLRFAAGMDSRPQDIELIDYFLASIKSIGEWQRASSKEGDVMTPSPAASTPACYAPEEDLHEGFHNTKNDFMELLSPAHDGKVRVISIVGCGGVGKTVLARAVYEATSLQLSTPAAEIHGADETEIYEIVAANEAAPVQPSPPTEEFHEPIAFNCKAWVEASTCKVAGDLINMVLNELDPTAVGRNTSEALHKFLHDKRYLVIIDDLRLCDVQWKDIEHVFPENWKNNRIIVTTSVHSIARDYSSGSYYVYPMQYLGEANSEKLFWKKVLSPHSRTPSGPEGDRSRIILSKCDGSPMALISAGNYLHRENNRHLHLSEDLCKAVCKELDNIAASEVSAFRELKRMFVQCYNSLTDYDHKNCLLYLSIYPRGHEINSKGFSRRLKAEQLVDGDALRCWKKLTDNSMIEPAPIRKQYNDAKRCKVQGMMMEFVIHKSVSRNLVTLIEEGNVRRNKPDKKVRRLSVHSSCSTREGSKLIPDEIELSTVRSLTIFNTKHPAETYVSRVDFKSCKMMRVLDLEGCKGLNSSSGVLDATCELLLLKYLNLKNTDIDKLPSKVKNLKHLEMLDVRHTRVEILPVEVIMLPELAQLVGQFELPRLSGTETEALTKFLKEKSKLHTLGGIVIQKMRGVDIVIRNARKLKKLKICGNNVHTATCAPQRILGFRAFWGFFRKFNPLLVAPSGSSTNPPLPSASPASTSTNLVAESRRTAGVFASVLRERFMDLESLSIGSSAISKALLASDLKAAPSVISSIKLRGPLTSLAARPLKNLRNLSKLRLFATGLGSKQLVEALQSLDRLEYLKLGEEGRRGSWEGDFCVQGGGFPALRELCFAGPNLQYPRLKIAQDAMRLLSSLQLLCPNLGAAEAVQHLQYHPNPLTRVEGMEHLLYLDEVILHHTADAPTVNAWKNAARMHTNMPCVKKQPEPA